MKIFEKISPSLFVLVVLCFVLPFIELSCAGQTISISGLDLVKGFTIEGESVDPNPLAIAALLIAFVGAGLFFWKNGLSAKIQVGLGIVGAILMLVLKSMFEEGVADEGIDLNWLAGYWIALIGYIAATGTSLFSIFGKTVDSSGTPVIPYGSGVTCPSCRQVNGASNNWCEFCGTKLDSGSQVAAPQYNYSSAPVSGSETMPIYTPAPAPAPAPTPAAPPVMVNTEPLADSATMPLQAEAVAFLNDQPLAFLRIKRVGRWELIPILKKEFIIGSAHNSTDYQEHSGNLGQIHARIDKTGPGFSIAKMDVDKAAYVNDQSLINNQAHPLSPGDIIRLNDIEYIFDLA